MNVQPKFKRAYRACLNCRVRKVKCDLGSADNPKEGKCLRCTRERKDCVFVESRRGSDGLTNRKVGAAAISNDSLVAQMKTTQRTSFSSDPNGVSTFVNNANSRSGIDPKPRGSNGSSAIYPDANHSTSDSPSHFSTMEGALVFLAKAAGTIAKADERDHIDAKMRHEQLEASLSSSASEHDLNDPSKLNTSNQSGIAANYNELNERERERERERKVESEREREQTRDQTRDRNRDRDQVLERERERIKENEHIPLSSQNFTFRRSVPPAEKSDHVRPKASTKLSTFEYIGGPNAILSEQEAENLIHLFFTTMHPFFPYIPKFLHQPKVLAQYPILLCSILTISSRYHPFANNVGRKGVLRNIEVHDSLWLYVQRLISQTVWAEASTRSIGTIFAFLLFTEWNPRAIHWRWVDYANKAEDINDKEESQHRDMDVNIAGIGAMRRSYRMGWMLIGSAIRLAQDMEFIDVSPNTFLACHVAEINSVMNISRRSMLAHSLADIDLDDENYFANEVDKIDYDQAILNIKEEDVRKLSIQSNLKFTRAQRAKIELLQITCLGHESFYGYKPQLGSLSQRQNLAVLNLLSPILKNWGKKYNDLLIPSRPKYLYNINGEKNLMDPESKESMELLECVERESLIFEYNYTKLYIYSLALNPFSSSDSQDKSEPKRTKLKLEEISKAAKFIEQAFAAANEMLSVTQRIHKIRVLSYMPVRWVTRIVRAIAFVVKCYLTINKSSNNVAAATAAAAMSSSFENFDSQVLSLSLISTEEIMQTIQKAAITLRDCSPDELHLCTRYSNVLMYLCSEMKIKSRNSNEHMGTPNPKRLKTNGGQSEFNRDQFTQTQINNPINVTNSTTDPISDANDNKNQQPSSSFNFPNYYSIPTNSVPINDQQIPKPTDNNMVDGELVDWFANNKDIGLDFVAPWTEMIEQQLDSRDFNFDEALQ